MREKVKDAATDAASLKQTGVRQVKCSDLVAATPRMRQMGARVSHNGTRCASLELTPVRDAEGRDSACRTGVEIVLH